jgi:hypothetical protein
MIPQRYVQNLVEIGGRIGRNKQDLLARIGQLDSGCAGNGRFANATFASEEQVTGGI